MDREKAKEAKRKRTQFYRRKQGAVKKAFELHDICEAEVYLCVRKSGRTYIFSSTKTGSPFSEQKLVRTA